MLLLLCLTLPKYFPPNIPNHYLLLLLLLLLHLQYMEICILGYFCDDGSAEYLLFYSSWHTISFRGKTKCCLYCDCRGKLCAIFLLILLAINILPFLPTHSGRTLHCFDYGHAELLLFYSSTAIHPKY